MMTSALIWTSFLQKQTHGNKNFVFLPLLDIYEVRFVILQEFNI